MAFGWTPKSLFRAFDPLEDLQDDLKDDNDEDPVIITDGKPGNMTIFKSDLDLREEGVML